MGNRLDAFRQGELSRPYRGHKIIRTKYQGLVAYWTPAFGSGDLATSLTAIKRWIDQAIASGELRRD